MAPYIILVGDCIEQMHTLPDESVHCVVTSPPYWGLRDYGAAGQIGLEPTPDKYVASMIAVFREVRRVLRSDGTLWLNLGDSYSSGGRTTQVAPTLRSKGHDAASGKQAYLNNFAVRPGAVAGIKPKDLIGIPWRVAFALQADGWYLRQDIIWHKPNPMPESVTDRCTKSHEYIFLFAKSHQYYFDQKAIKEHSSTGDKRKPYAPGQVDKRGSGHDRKGDTIRQSPNSGELRNKRDVWTVTTKPFKGAHFATFPPDLIEPCILAGAPICGTVLDPFGGSGTTAAVANRLGRYSILCELNPDYVALAEARCAAVEGHPCL